MTAVVLYGHLRAAVAPASRIVKRLNRQRAGEVSITIPTDQVQCFPDGPKPENVCHFMENYLIKKSVGHPFQVVLIDCYRSNLRNEGARLSVPSDNERSASPQGAAGAVNVANTHENPEIVHIVIDANPLIQIIVPFVDRIVGEVAVRNVSGNDRHPTSGGLVE